MTAKHILLVQYSETQALRLQLLFAAQGWPTERASSGEEAIAKLSEIVPDLIILDQYLPGLNGAELCNLLRLKANGWNPPILMFTSDYASESQRESVESGADAYLSKPVEDSILLLRVRALLGQSEANRRAAEQGVAVPRPARLLVVDDSPAYQEYLRQELSDDGHAVETAGSGREGLEKVKANRYDCVLVDLIMPGMDGIAMCATITGMAADLPSQPFILMLTGTENSVEMARGLEAGADDFILKSSDIALLRARVRALVRRKVFQDTLKDKEIQIMRLDAATRDQWRRSSEELQAQTNARKQLEEKTTLLAAIEAMPQIVWAAAPDGDIDYYNGRWFEYTGMTASEQSKARGWQPAVHPDDLQTLINRWTLAVTTCEPFESEVRFKRASDGLYRGHIARSLPIRNEQGEVTRWFGTCTDIEDFKQAQKQIEVLNEGLEERVRQRTADLVQVNGQLAGANESLQRAERSAALLAAIVASSDDAIISETLDGVVTSWNAGAESLFGYTAGEAIGRHLGLLTPQDGFQREKELLDRLLDSAAVEHLETTRSHKNGQLVQVSVTVSPVRDAGGRVIGVSKILRDTGERLRAEAKLQSAIKARELAQEGNALLAAIINSSDDAIVSETLQDIITSWNSGAERLFGYTAAEAIGRHIALIVPPEEVEIQKQMLERLREGGAVEHLETVRQHKNGETVQVSLTLSPIHDESGVVTGASTILRDISARLRAEELILDLNRQLEILAANADTANRAKSTFLSNMSHEIRTPLNALLGYSQLMARDPSLSADAKAHLKIMGRSGEHLLTLINAVLDMSKIEAGHIEVNPAEFDLTPLLDDLASMFRLRAEAKGLRFEMVMPAEPLPYLVADEDKVRQALINLLGNAIKFTRRGHVELLVRLEQRNSDSLWLSFGVKDTGAGLTDADQKRLFEPFTQAKDKLNTQEGTGLGLAISRQFARLMGGDITLASNPGEGSLFQFEIPVKRGDGADAHKRTAPRRVIAIRGGPVAPRILIADDRLENRDWLEKLLTIIGFSVRSADDGQSAIREWEQWQPHVILMDMHMPVMDGLEATRRIKADPRGSKTFIVVLTASALEEDRRAVGESGADAYLTKPCREDELMGKICALLKIECEYEREDDTGADLTALNAGMLAQLPALLAEELREATLSGNRRILNQLILRVRASDAGASADAIKELVDKYEYDTLTRVLEEAIRR
jgi:PAS domain S-box-containing protein